MNSFLAYIYDSRFHLTFITKKTCYLLNTFIRPPNMKKTCRHLKGLLYSKPLLYHLNYRLYIIQITNKTFSLNHVMQLTSFIKPSIMNTCYRHSKSLLCTAIIQNVVRTFKIQIHHLGCFLLSSKHKLLI